MKIFATLRLLLVLLSASAYALPAASGNFTLSLTKIKGTGAYLKGAVDAGARAALFKGRAPAPGKPTIVPVSIAGNAVVAKVGVGDPVEYYSLVLDTASSITWCKPYIVSSTTKPTSQYVHSEYGKSSFTGIAYLDRLTLSNNLVIENQLIGGALWHEGFELVDGVLGLGPVGLTRGKLYPDESATVPTVMDNLHEQKKIAGKILGVFLPGDETANWEGSVTYGGIDSRLYEGELTYVRLTTTFPASVYWGIDVSSCTYGDDDIIFQTSTPGVVDTGSALILLADNHFKAYLKAIPGAQYDWETNLVVVSRRAFAKMKPLHFTIGGRVFTLDVGAQLIPREQNREWGGDPRKHYSWIGRLGQDSGRGLDLILGQPFLRRYYTVFDEINSRIGFAQTEYTSTG